MTARCSVLVVSHDTRDQLATALRRLADQADVPHETIVIDSGSSDGSPQLVRDEFPDCRLLALDDNVGFGRANNLGAAAAHGEYLLLLNSDAWPQPGCLPQLMAALDGDPGLAMATPALEFPDGSRQFAWYPITSVVGEMTQMARNRFESRAWAHRIPPSWLRPWLGPHWYTAACTLLRRAAFEAVGGFDENLFLYFEDVDLALRLRAAGWQLGWVPEAHAVHLKGGSSDPPRQTVAYRRSQLYYYDKHRPAWERRVLRRRLRRKFESVDDEALRGRLLALLDPT